MTARFLVLFLVIGLASTCVVKAQVAAPAHLPAQSPSPAKKNRHLKGVEATASPAETLTSPVTTESPGVSPEASRPREKHSPKQQRAQLQVLPRPVDSGLGSLNCLNRSIRSARRPRQHRAVAIRAIEGKSKTALHLRLFISICACCAESKMNE